MYAGTFAECVDLLIPASFPWIDGEVEVQNNKRTSAILEQGFYDQVSKSTGKVLRIYKNYLDDLKNYNLTETIKNIKARTYVIAGLLDSEYHIENSKKLYNLLNCKKRLFLLADVPHDLANTPKTSQIFRQVLENIFELEKNNV